MSVCAETDFETANHFAGKVQPFSDHSSVSKFKFMLLFYANS